MKSALSERFQRLYGRAPAVLAQAPGRIEFIGNHTDYNGGPVLGAAIDRGVTVALAPRDDGRRRFASEQRPEVATVEAEAPLAPVTGSASWVNYPLGVLAAFAAYGLRLPAGFDYLADSDLPVGAGLSSSAAIELASALAFAHLTGERLTRDTLVLIGRHAENHFVGVPCGILDQGVSGFGRKDHLVFIDCRGPVFGTVTLPAGVHFWIFNTHTRHALVDGLYAERHRECMDAARALGVAQLAEASPSHVADRASHLSIKLQRRARHVVDEIIRVEATLAALRAGDISTVGALLTASHRSSQSLFENSTVELDFLVDALVASPHVHGARLTGGGFGGAVMALTSEAFDDAGAARVADAYTQRFGRPPDILHTQTGDGASLLSP
ncbi:MAG: galactokinase [Verrucomicrobia bacterium]|nr:galactokinase [Verrucomicrobiota bacterium]